VNVLLRGLVLGAGRAYGAAAAIRREVFRRELLRVHRIPVPVISVGALTVGGSGKTPVARYLARRLLEDGLRVAVVCGGYGGSRRSAVTLLDRGQAWGVGAAERYGDEAVMLARCEDLRGALVVCGQDRVACSHLAVREEAQVIVLDDGFQHVRLHRDLDVVLLSAGPVSGPADLPREGSSALAAADLTWGHQRDGGRGPQEVDVTSRSVAGRLLAADGTTVGEAADLRGQRVFLLAGIANPLAFRALVCAAGAEVVGERWVGDHRTFGARHLRAARRAGADLILCTEKDIARVGSQELTGLTVELELLGGAEHLGRALRAVVRRSGAC
jgi:tetraacyldisaccharide 4'-kinase